MKKVIFDIDGVLFSEENYFNVSALTIQEWLYDSMHFRLPTETNLSQIKNNIGNISATRYYIWGQDKLINFIKSKGINSEWDMVHAYLCTVIGLMAKEYFSRSNEKLDIFIKNYDDIKNAGLILMGLTVPKAEKILEYWESIFDTDIKGIKIFKVLLSDLKRYLNDTEWMQPQNSFWHMHKETFLNIYLGTDLFIKEFGKVPYNGRKEGFIKFDKSLAPAEKIKAMFQELKKEGYEIAIATGRKRIEVEIPFIQNNWKDEFNDNYIATVSDAEEIAKKEKCKIPDKPEPFIYYCAMFGRRSDNYLNYLNENVIINQEDEYIIVGDSVSDFLAANRIGVNFIGIVGAHKSSGFETFLKKENAIFVDSVLDVLQILKNSD